MTNNQHTADSCIFCYQNLKGKIAEECNSMIAIEDGFPVSKFHYLIIPKRHCIDYFALNEKERSDMDTLIKVLRKQILEKDSTVTGFNIGMNSGASAGQTVFHCHVHLIPRRDNDTPDPRGGVRGVIPAKMGY